MTSGALTDVTPGLLESELCVMADTHVTTLRAPFYWSAAQPYASEEDVPVGERERFRSVGGRPTSFAEADRLVVAAAQTRIALLPVVLGTPRWLIPI